MYKSPIDLLVTDIQHQIEKQQDEEIYKAVLHYVPNVDKTELIRALQYDRGQYEKGYQDGEAAAMASIVHCKDCVHWKDDILRDDQKICDIGFYFTDGNGYCVYGERRTDNG